MKDLPTYQDKLGKDFDLGVELNMARWTDISHSCSWCACFEICVDVEGHGLVDLKLWVDHEDRGRREVSSNSRYSMEIQLNSKGLWPADFWPVPLSDDRFWSHFYDTECSVKLGNFLKGVIV